jgi:hypothetical protein
MLLVPGVGRESARVLAPSGAEDDSRARASSALSDGVDQGGEHKRRVIVEEITVYWLASGKNERSAFWIKGALTRR